MAAAANTIVSEHISHDAEKQVNLEGSTTQTLLDAIKAGKFTPQLFDDAEKEVIKLMSKDSFPRFKMGDLFKQLLDQLKSYTYGPRPSLLGQSLQSAVCAR